MFRTSARGAGATPARLRAMPPPRICRALASALLPFALACAGDEPSPVVPPQPAPPIDVRLAGSEPGRCEGEWCSYGLVIESRRRATGSPVATPLAAAGDGRAWRLATALPDGRGRIIWEFPNRAGRWEVLLCAAHVGATEPGECASARATVFPPDEGP